MSRTERQEQTCTLSSRKHMAKLYPLAHDAHGAVAAYGFYCPGCQCDHMFSVLPVGHPTGKTWRFDGNLEAPTFAPSLVCNISDPKARCHCFVEFGNIRYLDDCYHELASKTVPMRDWDKE